MIKTRVEVLDNKVTVLEAQVQRLLKELNMDLAGEDEEEFFPCPNCKSECHIDDNFCSNCMVKLRGTCICWVKNYELFNCGREKCPGLELLLEEQKAKLRP